MFSCKVLLLFGILSPFVSSSLLPQIGDSDGRIVGGLPINITSAPFQVALLYEGSLMCGGSIISSKSVVTAAHCTDGQSASSLSIRAGSNYHASGGQVVAVSEIHQHPLYSFLFVISDFDVSVLTLQSSIDSAIGSPIPLATSLVSPGTIVRVSGWGTTSEGGAVSNVLLAVDLPIVSKVDCQKAYLLTGLITKQMICAGFTEGGKDSCQGDSGGPLTYNNELVGIVSWGSGCARAKKPGVYANVYQLREFIESKRV